MLMKKIKLFKKYTGNAFGERRPPPSTHLEGEGGPELSSFNRDCLTLKKTKILPLPSVIVYLGNGNTRLHNMVGCFIESLLALIFRRSIVKVPPESGASSEFNHLLLSPP